MGFWDEKEAKSLFEELPFYNTSIEKPYIKYLNNMGLLLELPFFNDLSIAKMSKTFRGYAWIYKTKIGLKDLSVQLTISKPSIEDFFKDLLDEIKDFKYQITLKISLSKYKENANGEFTTTYVNSTAKAVFKSKYDLDKYFQKVFNKIDNWISEGHGWVIESIDAEYVNTSIYSPLSESSYIKLPVKFEKPKRGLIKIKNDGNKSFLWCHIRHLNPLKHILKEWQK